MNTCVTRCCWRDAGAYQTLCRAFSDAGYLPWPNDNATTAKVERVSKAFAKGLRARLALAAGGYAQRLDGTVKLSSDPDLTPTKMYEIAKKECLDIIGSQKLRLLGYEEVFRKLNEEAGAFPNNCSRRYLSSCTLPTDKV